MGDVAVTARRAGSPIDELLAAVAFLTRLPVASHRTGGTRTGAAAFGLVGAVLGLIAAIPLAVLGSFHALLASIAAVALLALLDGGLHLDGLADTFDALAAPGDAAERARTDPRAGIAGVVAIVAVLGLDVAALAELATRDGWRAAIVLVAAVTVCRAVAPAWAVTVGRRWRPADGLGAWFAGSTTTVEAVVAAISAVLVTLVLVELGGPLVALAVLVGLGVSAIVGGIVVRARHQLDGDGYGALIEITLAAVLVSAAVLAAPTAG